MVFRAPAWLLRSCLALLVAASPAGCGRPAGGPLGVALIDDSGGAPRTLDPGGEAARLLRAATTEGLVSLDAEGRVTPALADRWIVTDDGASYVFRLRDGNWPDGRLISAETAAEALRRTLAAVRRTSLGLQLSPVDQVRVMSARVIEIDLAAPMPDLLALLAQPELGLEWRSRGTGPMVLRRAGNHRGLALLPPERRGLPADPDFALHSRPLAIDVLPTLRAIEQFNNGTIDVLLGGTVDNLPLAGSGSLTRGNVQLDPVIGLYGLRLESAAGFLADPSNREALALAIDRDALIAAFNIGGWQPTTRLVSPLVLGDLGTIGERWAGDSMEARRAAALGRVRRWQASGAPLPVLQIALPGGPGSQLLLDRLRSDWGAIGIAVRRVRPRDRAEVRLIDAVATHAGADWFLDQLSCTANPALCSAAADARTNEARRSADAQQRAALFAEAEAELTAANTYIPLARPLRWSMVRSSVSGFATNPLAWHPLPPFALLPK